jgi:cytochrome P450
LAKTWARWGAHRGLGVRHGQYGRGQPGPARYDGPERLDITREEPPAMLTFGGGMHYCLGAHLARVELAEALTVLARRMPNLRRTGPAPWKSIFEISGPTTLPIAFEAGH